MRKRRSRQRGAVAVEYAAVLLMVGIPLMGGLAAGGVKMIANYRATRAAVLNPRP
jgi:hypothetical protein